MPVVIRTQLHALVDHLERQLLPATEDQLAGALAQTAALLGYGGGEGAKAEWIAAAAIRLEWLPADVAIEGLRHAEETCDNLRQVVKSVMEYAGTIPSGRRAKLKDVLLLASVLVEGEN